METTGVIIGLASLIIAILTFKYAYFSKPIKELESLKIHFRANQRLALDIRGEIESLINKFGIGDSVLFPGLTYSAYLEGLNNSLKGNLSNAQLDKIESLDLSLSSIQSMQKSLENQFNALVQVKEYLKIQRNQLESSILK